MKLLLNKKTYVSLYQRSHGYASVAMVAAIAITALLGLMTVFRQGMRSHESQVRNQIKVDYRQKEDALLRALIAIVPNKAVGAMQQGSSSNATDFSWNTIFTEAIVAAKAATALDSAVVSSFGISNIVNANSGDITSLLPSGFVAPIAGTGTLVGEGITANSGLLSSAVGGKLPEALVFSGASIAGLSAPIISSERAYASPTVALFPRYNTIPYPDVRFGLVNQSGNFIAKRNWWAFSLTFGNGVTLTNNTGTADSAIPTVTKNYVLSIYEVPSQLAVSAGAKLDLSGGAWGTARIRGSVFGAEVDASGLSVTGGSASISARRKVNLGGGASVGGSGVSNNYNALGTRETRWSADGTDNYGASDAGSSGRVAILPLSQGELFLRRNTPVTNSLSPTGWDTYALGSRQCKMQIEIIRNSGLGENKPIFVRFHYLNAAGNAAAADFVPGVNNSDNWRDEGIWENHNRDTFLWNDDNNAGTVDVPSIIPFYWEDLDPAATGALNINPVLAIKLGRFPAFLAALGAAPVSSGVAGAPVNNSLSVWSNPTDATVSTPSMPSSSNELGVVIRNARDMRAFTSGFSVVTDHRIYLVGEINDFPVTAPAGSGIGLGAPYYPPLSFFAAEKRFGTATISSRNVTLIGQLTSLQEDDGSTVNPLSLQTGTGASNIATGSISADLSQIDNPAKLPPVNKMTWLVTIEEIHP